jgi:hypothetical protein
MTTTDYVSLDEFRAYIKDTSTLDPAPMQNAILTASRAVELFCDRNEFYQATDVRYFWPQSFNECSIDDIATTTGLLVDVDAQGNGTYNQPWTLNTDYFLEPVNLKPGWPYEKISATFAQKFMPMRRVFQYMRPTVRVTGTFGWPAVPDAIRQAVFVAAAQLYKLGDAPFGVAGFGEFGVVRVRENPVVMQLLAPYAKTAGVVVA